MTEHRWRCQNPRCPSASHGGRVLLIGELAPGSDVEPTRCPICKRITRIIVGADGRPRFTVRAAWATPDTEATRAG